MEQETKEWFRARKQGHSEFPDIKGRGRTGTEVTGGAWICRGSAEPVRVAPGGAGAPGSPHLPIDVFAVFDGEHVHPLGTDATVENAIGPDSVGPDLVLLKVAFQRFAIEGVLGEVTEGFLDSFSRGVVTILEVFERLRCETDLPHCSSPKALLKE